MGKFNKGDIVIGNSRNKYGVTKRGVKCEVIQLDSRYYGEVMEVQVLDGSSKGTKHWVDEKYFDLVERAKPAVSTISASGITTKGSIVVKGTGNSLKLTPSVKSGVKVDYDEALEVTFVRVGDATIAVPLKPEHVSITVKDPKDVECEEIAKAMAFYRLHKGVRDNA